MGRDLLGIRLINAKILGDKPIVIMASGAHFRRGQHLLTVSTPKGLHQYGLWASLVDETDATPSEPLPPGNHGLALGRLGGDGTLYRARAPALSGYSPPSKEHQEASPWLQTKEVQDIRLHSLDRLIREGHLPAPDILGIDFPGSGAEVLKGASWALRRNVCALRLRECMANLYQGGSAFADSDALLRDRGFSLFQLNTTKGSRGEAFFAEALYLRNDGDSDRGLPNPGLRLRRGIVASLLGEDVEAQRLLGTQGGEWAAGPIRAAIRGAQAPMTPAPPTHATAPWMAALPAKDPRRVFLSEAYKALNASRLKAIIQSKILVGQGNILEVGAGVGEMSQALLAQDICLTLSDGRAQNVDILKARFPRQKVRLLNIEDSRAPDTLYDGVLCLGVIHHLANPGQALSRLGELANDWLLIEGPVDPGPGVHSLPIQERATGADDSLKGMGCLPREGWLIEGLKAEFPYVYRLATGLEPGVDQGGRNTHHRVMLLGSRRVRQGSPWVPIEP